MNSKTKFLIGTWTALMLASCSGDDGTQPVIGEEFITEGTPEMVHMAAHAAAASASTKGYGTVGSTDDADNKWRENQAIYLYAVTSDYTTVWNEFDNRKAYVQDNSVVYFGSHTPTPNPEEDMGLASYYELGKVNEKNSYWFYGYHVDDAAQMGTNSKGQAAPVVNMSSTLLDDYYIDLTIDGTQDIMVAKIKDDPFAGNSALTGYQYGYSAYTSRRGATPDLVFNHCLTRFTIEAVAADDNADGIRIDEMAIYSKTKAQLFFMKPADQSLVRANDENDGAAWLTLKKYDAATNEMVDLNPAADCTLSYPADQSGRMIGNGIICMPKKTSTTDVSDKYVLRIKQTQEKNGREESQTFYLPIQKADGSDVDFQPGTSYKLSVTFHGFTAVRVTATLTPWATGEDIPMDPDDLL